MRFPDRDEGVFPDPVLANTLAQQTTGHDVDRVIATYLGLIGGIIYKLPSDQQMSAQRACVMFLQNLDFTKARKVGEHGK